MKLLIRNLARSTTEADLQTLFEPFGKIQSCKLVVDPKTGQSKGFGFIEIPSPGQAKAAMKTLNGKELGGNKIRVKKAATNPQTTDNSNKTDSVSTTVTPVEKTPPHAKEETKDASSKYASINKTATPDKKSSPAVKEKTKTAPAPEKASSKDPLHGITLEQIVTKLEDKYGWDELGKRIDIKCFTTDPSVSSSLKFLRKTPWAREKVEKLYLNTSWTKTSVWEAARNNKKR